MTFAIAFAIAASTYNLPMGLLDGLCFVESRHNPIAYQADDGGSPSLGICQVKLATAQGLGFNGTADELAVPDTNIDYAGKYLRQQIRRCGSIDAGIQAYSRGNCGPNGGYLRKVKEAYGQ